VRIARSVRRGGAALAACAAAPAIIPAGAARPTASCTPGGLPAGSGWTRANALRGYEMEDVGFSSSCAGVVVGTTASALSGAVLVTSDGGRTFGHVRVPRGVSDLKAVAVSGRLAWAAGTGGGGGIVLVSRDRGRHWHPALLPHGAAPLRALAVGAGRDYAGGRSTLLVSSDGGAGWKRTMLPRSVSVFGLAARGTRQIVAVGTARGGAGALASFDGGRSWRRTRLAATGTLFRVQLVDGRHGFAGGAELPARGGRALLAATVDGGRTWRRVPVAHASAVLGLRFVTTRIGWIAVRSGARGEIRYTTDGGHSWQVQLRSDFLGPGPIVFRGRQDGWLVGDFGLYATTAGGRP
jgi:photosystem II stability/assembly factor-like uncharacterized protein